MGSVKTSMSTSYKAVFILSILMIFVVIIGGAMSGSKSVGFGIWYGGYTAWKMYKRDNDSLVSLQKIMLWFQAVAFSIGLAVLLFSDSDVKRYVDITPLGLIIVAAISMGITYFLYIFFIKQKSAPTSVATLSSSSIEDRFWEQASRELESERHEATWARAMANAEGDDAKTKALYIKLRASDLQQSYSLFDGKSRPVSTPKEGIVKEESRLFWSSFNSIGKIAIVGILALIGYAIYDSSKSSDETSSPSSPTSSPNQVSKPTFSDKPVKSIEEVNTVCYVYWDGRRWQSGKTEGDNFLRFAMGRYGVHVMTFALPIQMAKEFGLSKDSSADIDVFKGEIGGFMKEHWNQLEAICTFR